MSNSETTQTSAPKTTPADRTARIIAWTGLAVSALALGNSLFGPIKVSFSVGDETFQTENVQPLQNPVAQTTPQAITQERIASAATAQITLPTTTTSVPTAAPQTEDIQIFNHENVMYAYDPVTGTWFTFDPQSSAPIPMEHAQVPIEVRDGTIAAVTVDNVTVADTRELEQQALSSITATTPGADPELRINHLLQDEPTAATIIQALDRLPGVQVIGGPNDNAPLYMFYDPRCPYCHAAYRELQGRVSMRLIPTLALGAGAEAFSAAILGPIDVTRSTTGEITAVELADDPERVLRLDAAMRADAERSSNNILTMSAEERAEHDATQDRMRNLRSTPLAPGSEEEEAHEYVLQQTYTVMRQLYGSQQSLLAVPTAIMPRADGTARAYRGIDDSTIALILADAAGHTQ